MSDVSLITDVTETVITDSYRVEVTAIVHGDIEEHIELSLTGHYDEPPRDIHIQLLKDDMLDMLYDAGLYSGGKD